MSRITRRGLQQLSNASQYCAVKRRQIAAGLLRIALGSLTVVFYALHLSQRSFLWGPNGVVSWQDQATLQAQGRAWTLYRFFPSLIGSECLYWIGLIISLMFTLGLFSRLTPILFFAFTWSLYQRNWYAIDGGDNLLFILALGDGSNEFSPICRRSPSWFRIPTDRAFPSSPIP